MILRQIKVDTPKNRPFSMEYTGKINSVRPTQTPCMVAHYTKKIVSSQTKAKTL